MACRRCARSRSGQHSYEVVRLFLVYWLAASLSIGSTPKWSWSRHRRFPGIHVGFPSTDLWMTAVQPVAVVSVRVSVMASFLWRLTGLEEDHRRDLEPAVSMSSRIWRTTSNVAYLAGSVMSQSRYRLPEYTGTRVPHKPIVTMTSAWSPIWSVSFRGASWHWNVDALFLSSLERPQDSAIRPVRAGGVDDDAIASKFTGEGRRHLGSTGVWHAQEKDFWTVRSWGSLQRRRWVETHVLPNRHVDQGYDGTRYLDEGADDAGQCLATAHAKDRRCTRRSPVRSCCQRREGEVAVRS